MLKWIGLGSVAAAAVAVVFAGQEPRPLSYDEVNSLKDRLVELYRHDGSVREIGEIHERLLRSGQRPEQLERDRLIREVGGRWAAWMGNRRRAEEPEKAEEYRRRALKLGLTEEEIGIYAEVLPGSAEEARLVHTLFEDDVRSSDFEMALNRLNRILLSPRARARIVDGISSAFEVGPGNDMERAEHLLSVLSSSWTEDVLEACATQWATNPKGHPVLREKAVYGIVLHDKEGTYRDVLRELAENPETPRSVRRAAVGGLKKLGDPSADGLIARLAEAGDASLSMRMAAFDELERDGLTADEGETIWKILRSPNEPSALRIVAFLRLKQHGLIKTGDEAFLDLLRSDPALEFRMWLAHAVVPQLDYPAGEAVKTEAAELRRLEAAETVRRRAGQREK